MKKIYEFPVLYSGWECDGTGWIVEDEHGVRQILLTNHGGEYIANPNELLEKIDEYQQAINKTTIAIKLLKP